MDKTVYNTYIKNGFVVFSVILSYNYDKQKKNAPIPCAGYNELTIEHLKKNSIIPTSGTAEGKEITPITLDKTGIGLLCGCEYETNKYIVLIDIDNKQNENIKNGFDLWNLWKNEDKTIDDTIKETTPSGKGYHYYYYVSKSQIEKLKNAYTTLSYNDNVYAVDAKIKKQFSIIAPSYFMVNNKKLSYNFVGPELWNKSNIRKLPKIIYDTLINNTIKKNVIASEINETTEKNNDKNFTIKYNIDVIRNILKYIGKNDDYTRWQKIGCIIKNLNYQAFDCYNEWCKSAKNYDKKACLTYFNNVSHYKNIGIGSLLKYAKDDKIDGYLSLFDNLKKNFITHVNINTRYLSDNADFLACTDAFINNNKFHCFTVSSPYGTGKTKFIHDIIKKYQPKKVLYVSYRRALCDYISSDFKNENFENYKNKHFDSNRIVIQLDSINKLQNDYYDLVICDEIESILMHLSSPMLRNKQYLNDRIVYNRLYELCKNSGKVIFMDGDIHNRAITFAKSIASNNIILHNSYVSDTIINYEINHNKNETIEQIKKMFTDNKKIIVCCMSSADVNYISNELKKIDNKKIILSYTSETDDNIKTYDMQNINTSWGSADIVLYSPTIEAGLSYDNKNIVFDERFLIYSQMSCSVRSSFQMLSRVRKFKSDIIHVCMENATKNINDTMLTLDEITEKYKKIMNKSEIDTFEQIICYNEYETNLSTHNFENEFKNECIKRGANINIIQFAKAKKRVITGAKEQKINLIANTEIKDTEKCIKNIENGKASVNDKLVAEKYFYIKHFNVSDANISEFLKKFAKKTYIISNHMILVDIKNIDYYNQHIDDKIDYNIEIEIQKRNCVMDMIDKLGLKIYNNKKIKCEYLDNIHDDIIKLINKYYTLSNMKKVYDGDNNKKLFGAINNILHLYGFKLSIFKKGAKYASTYEMNFYNDINKYIKYNHYYMPEHMAHLKNDFFECIV